MGVYQILGGRRLCGTVTVQGSKNAVLPMIAAAVLTKEEIVLEGCPKISDVEDMAEIVRSLGGTVWWERNALHLNCEKIEKSRVEGALSKRLRASLLFLGSLLARTGEAYLAGAGGCRIGKRPTDLHQRAMELLGAEVFEEDGTIRAKADHPKGAVLSEKERRGDGKCGSFCCRSGRCNKAGALCAGAGSGSSLPVS